MMKLFLLNLAILSVSRNIYQRLCKASVDSFVMFLPSLRNSVSLPMLVRNLLRLYVRHALVSAEFEL